MDVENVDLTPEEVAEQLENGLRILAKIKGGNQSYSPPQQVYEIVCLI